MAAFNFSEFYSKFSKREKILAMTACGTTILLVMNLLLISPILAYMREMDVEIAAKISALKRSRRVLSFEKSIVREYAKYAPYFDPADLTQEEIIANLLQKIEDLARKREISILSVSPGEIEERKTMQQYTTSLECEGKLPNMLGFMSTLEGPDYLFEVTTYQFAPKSKSGDVIKVSLTISRMIVSAEDMGDIELPPPPPKEEEFPPLDTTAAPDEELPAMDGDGPAPETDLQQGLPPLPPVGKEGGLPEQDFQAAGAASKGVAGVSAARGVVEGQGKAG